MKKIPKKQTLLNNLGKIAYTLDKTYLSRLENDYDVLPFDENFNKDNITYSSNIRALEVKRWVYDKDEKVTDCFKNVMSVFAESENTLALVIHRTPSGTRMFFVNKNFGAGRNEDSKNDIVLLKDSLCGNFPGTRTHIFDAGQDDLEKIFNFKNFRSIAAFCNIPSEKSDDYICQGIEKLLNGIVPKNEEESYFVVILAESLPQSVLREILSGYQEMATAITPFAGYQFQAGKNSNETEGEMESLSHSEGISHSVTRTHSVNAGVNAGVQLKGIFNVGGSAGYGYSWGETDSINKADIKATGKNRSISLGTSENTTFTYKSYVVADLIEKLETTIKRINESQSTGLWKCASYVLSQESKTSKNIANFLRSITQGDDSYIQPSFINEWSRKSSNGVTAFGEAIKYLSHFCHPVFVNKIDKTIFVTPTMNVSTTELSHVFAFPRYSVQGVPVIECARFGREPHSLLDLINDVEIGCSYHMHTREENRISINKEELTKHTFITGSTGSGKSNAIYTIINRLCCGKNKNKPHFLVIEPAKGEYKDVFGGYDDVAVYGTNPYKSPNLLQLNPFTFPDDVHVLEHVDRLVEVFNACWPMYAAMPAILKESVEKAYEYVGWNLKISKNPGEFPTFDTLMLVLPEVIDSSAYSKDTSNDYKGALITRVRSLTRGIHGQIFGNDLPAEDLFNNNAIVDISRIGSNETKALIMGILVLKLQEFRMSEGNINSPLRHITILEEAHNLLRRTSTEQSQDSSNLQGKSVEMIANAIAEMRTYGEGFIIADQSPGLMDMSVIRNTNTKIILRLPDESDRILVGKSAGLNDSQISELAKLERGVAAVSQSDWLEPVLCYFDKFEDFKAMKERYNTDSFTWNDSETQAVKKFINAAFDVEKLNLNQDEIDLIRKWRDTFKSEETKRAIDYCLKQNKLNDTQKMLLICNLVGEKIKVGVGKNVITEVNKALIGRYDFDAANEVVRRINDLFLVHFPINVYLQESMVKLELPGKENVR